MVHAYLFDLDGVLTDTAEFHFLAWKQLADEEGIEFTREDNEHLRGVSRRESLALLLKGRPVTEELAAEMMQRKNGYYVELIAQITPNHLLPGVKPLLQHLQKHEKKVAVASVSKNAKAVIDRLGIMEHIHVLTDGFSVEKSKPEPDIFLFTAQQLGVAPADCVVIEDAAAGVLAAHRAGMGCIGIGAAAAQADIVLEGVGAVTPEIFMKHAEVAKHKRSIGAH